MTGRAWDGGGPVLADTSAWIQARRDSNARELLLAAVQRNELCWCWPVRYELMVDARGPEGIAAVERSLEGLREIPVDRAVQRAVLATMRELAAAGSHGAHRFALTDLTVTLAAQTAGVGVLHFDQHLDQLGKNLGVTAHWISGPNAKAP
ncbi:MAG: PIN domain-containing protein [Actinobacteria bacterium]|nr:PIN domain-containing protein [Actinomycetota bacterium]